MKKSVLFLLIVISFITIFGAFSGTKFSMLGIYTMNLDDSRNFVDVFPIAYFDIGLTDNLSLRFNDYITLSSSTISIDYNEDETLDFKLPRYYYLQYKVGYDALLMFGKFKFKDYPYDMRRYYSFRIGGFRDDLGDSKYDLDPMKMAIGGYIKPIGDLKFGGAYSLEDKSIYAYLGLDERYKKYMFYLSQDNKHDKLSVSLAGYNSIRWNRKLITQLFYSAGYAVNSSVEKFSEIVSNFDKIIEILPIPKVVVGGKVNYYPYYLKGIVYYNMDENGDNQYYLDVDAATNNPIGKTWLYEVRFGYYLPKPWKMEVFAQGNSLDEGILTDYIVNYGVELIGENISLKIAAEDINGRADGNQRIVLGFTTWTDFIITERSLMNIIF
ncbi:hypothetical protein Marpi_0738 [Marinitoga piezophila KA3]|uniref:Uncharacterized protein n=1 Tax=Marinitoga piezophila (strain DSM 14283 / JCM 11233 / KA3) TaxID=443254 RepID=H2J6I3_MARPK|nr:hypothetical protein [Marinitoga piezophila]AEX85168.1 hypothetical protein Marpi_0738 [Marinitoga piezophila KA3]